MKWITSDPGEHTGWAVWDNDKLIEAGTLEMDEFLPSVAVAAGLPPGGRPDEYAAGLLDGFDLMVIEDWALYPWKLQSLAWDACRTARAIGTLEYICAATERPYVLQPAAIKDAAKAAGAEDLFYRPLHENRHQNDAIMHGVHAITTGIIYEYGADRPSD